MTNSSIGDTFEKNSVTEGTGVPERGFSLSCNGTSAG